MTNRDILTQILSEVTGNPKEQVAQLVETMGSNLGVTHNLDIEIPPIEAEELLNSLRQEKESILASLIAAGLKVENNLGHT